MEIRKTTTEDLDTVMDIYASARKFMVETGNPNQWGLRNWPPRERIEKDIELQKSYVCVDDDEILGVFFFDYGEDIEPTYLKIDGKWIGDNTYGVVHRIATKSHVHGVGRYCLNYAYEQCHHLRIDTHEDNKVMQKILTKLGFEYCGIIYVYEEHEPRYAYEKIGE